MIPVMTIAGSDSGGGAGIQADLKTFEAHGLFGTSVITAVTAQNTLGVNSVLILPPSVVTAQIDAILDDFEIRAIKIGMLASLEIVLAVAETLRTRAISIPIVLDPVMVATSGDRLLTPESVGAIRTELIPLATVITPNHAEASVICEALPERVAPLGSRLKMVELLLTLGSEAVLLTGGDSSGDRIVDWYGEKGGVIERFEGTRIVSSNTHGTGCTLSSSIAARIALGSTVRDAVSGAREYVRRAIEEAPDLGDGHGPLRHKVAI